MELIDTHSHLYEPEFDSDRDEALRRAAAEGVGRLLLPAIDSESHERLFGMVRRNPERCIPMMGLHPTSVNDNPHWRGELATVERYLRCSPEGIERFCAVGEIGLDYYWSQDFKAEQREAFVAQLRLAAELDLPVAIHTRAAWDDMAEIIAEEHRNAETAGRKLRGVFHAFTESAELWHRLSGFGDFMFGIGGVVTFKKSAVAEAVKEIPLGRIVLETDCPYLAPVPHRGKRNESAYIHLICEKVAELKGLTAAEVATATSGNAERLFGLQPYI